MPLRGRAFFSMWSGVLQGYERELDRWHTIEHMPERLGVPGFLRGRRFRASFVERSDNVSARRLRMAGGSVTEGHDANNHGTQTSRCGGPEARNARLGR